MAKVTGRENPYEATDPEQARQHGSALVLVKDYRREWCPAGGWAVERLDGTKEFAHAELAEAKNWLKDLGYVLTRRHR